MSIRSTIETIKNMYYVVLTAEQLEELLEGEPELKAEVCTRDSLDTADRSILLDLIAQKAGWPHWPMIGENADLISLGNALKMAGFELRNWKL